MTKSFVELLKEDITRRLEEVEDMVNSIAPFMFNNNYYEEDALYDEDSITLAMRKSNISDSNIELTLQFIRSIPYDRG
jgi:hypothetical protein